MASITNKPWDGSASRWPTAAAYAKACLINLNDGPSANWVKAKCLLPVYEPDGALNSNGVHSAASVLSGGMGGVKAPPDAKKAAARKLVRLYGQLNDPVPPSLKNMAS